MASVIALVLLVKRDTHISYSCNYQNLESKILGLLLHLYDDCYQLILLTRDTPWIFLLTFMAIARIHYLSPKLTAHRNDQNRIFERYPVAKALIYNGIMMDLTCCYQIGLAGLLKRTDIKVCVNEAVTLSFYFSLKIVAILTWIVT